MNIKQNVPQVRFKGFTDDWERRELGEVFTQTSNYVNPKEDNVELWSLTVEEGLIPKTERYTRDFLVKKEDKFKEVRPGDIVYNPMNMTLGAIGYNNMSKGIAVSGYYVTMVTNFNTDSYFINTWLKSPQAILTYKNYATGSLKEKQRIQFPTLSAISVPFPSLTEQQQIGNYFSNLDHLITLHQRKLETLKKLKKSMLQKMFPKNGSTYPEIRFSGFTDAWEQREFNSTFKILQNNTLSRAELCAKNGVIGNIHYGDILVKYGEVLDLEIETLPYIQSKEIADKFKASLLCNGDVVIADTAEDETVGKCTEIANLGTFEVLAGLHTIPLRPKQKYAVGYLGYYMNSNSFHDTLLPLMQGTKVTSISKSALQGTTISYPTEYNEQQQIGTYFKNLDHLITLHQRKLETLKKLKKSMLQKMFI